MTSLVERLRNATYTMFFDGWASRTIGTEAADRIEALERENAELRAHVGKLRKLATHANNCGHRFGHDCDCYLSSDVAIRALAKAKEAEK
ncbi:MAG TPA: hypothetical protein VGC14_25260 [Rhizobium sp.]